VEATKFPARRFLISVAAGRRSASEITLQLVSNFPQPIPVVLPRARPCHVVRNAGEWLLMTHPLGKLTAKLQRRPFQDLAGLGRRPLP